MKKPDPFFGFLWVYFTLALIGVVIFNFIISEQNDPLCSFAAAIAGASLTQFTTGKLITDLPAAYTYFSLLITQLSGFALLSCLLWYYWQFFGNEKEKAFGIFKALKLTFIACLISESLLLIFFLYAVSAVPSENNFLSALGLAVNSFMNAGIPLRIAQSHPEIIGQNFILQIGIIAGSSLGSLGIFVLYELFSPKKLRERLADTSIDWSYITKVSIFGTGLIFGFGLVIFYFSEQQHILKDKRIIDALISGVYEISASRGFGSFIFENETQPAASILKVIVSLFGSGPFSNGGGFTLLGFLWLISFFRTQKDTTIQASKLIGKNLFLFTAIAFIATFTVRIVLNTDMSVAQILSDHWKLYSTTEYNFEYTVNSFEKIIAALTVIAGRLSFIAACFLTLKQIKNKSNAPDFL